MRRKLTNEEIYMIVRGEEECGVNTLLQELYEYRDIEYDVYCNINEKGEYGQYELITRERN